VLGVQCICRVFFEWHAESPRAQVSPPPPMFGLAFAAFVIGSWIMLPGPTSAPRMVAPRCPGCGAGAASLIVAVCSCSPIDLYYYWRSPPAEMTDAKGLQIEAMSGRSA